MSNKIFRVSVTIVLLAFLVSGCTLPWKKKNLINDSAPLNQSEQPVENTSLGTRQLKKFETYNDLKNFLLENNNTKKQAAAQAETGAVVTLDSVNDYSSTNNQVARVDEADIVKTDGNYIYALVRNDLKIIKVNPASEASVVGTITFKTRPQDIFIHGTSLAVFGVDQQIYTLPAYKSFRRQDSYTFFKVFDLSNPAEPSLVRDLDFEGQYTDARLIGDYAYLFTNSSANYIENEPLVPRVLDGGNVLASTCDSSSKCYMPDVYYFDIPYDSYNFVNVTAINLKDNNEALSGESYIMNQGQNFYVSKNNIYLTYTEYLNEYDLESQIKRELIYPLLAVEEQAKIIKIEAAENYILSKNEKKSKVTATIDSYLMSLSGDEQTSTQLQIEESLKKKLSEKSKDMEKTIIHKIGINGSKVEYRGMGEVNGQVLNQFSMDESGDYFRIATTKNPIWSRLTAGPEKSYNNIFVLNNELKVVGSLENLETDEKIYAARFMGDRAYLVTFKQTDPLYVIGLSDPSKPSILGAIQVPGYSTYLHSFDKNGNKLIGFGRDTEVGTNGAVKIKGLKMALFDFSDLAAPKELDSYLIGDESSDSIALTDHKAFLYSETKNLLSIPAVLRENNKLSFAGALIFNVVDNHFVLKGKIDHTGGTSVSNSDNFGDYNYYDNTVKRSIFINDNLYTFSNNFLKINSLDTLSPVKNLVLTSGVNDYIISPAPILTPVVSDPLNPATTSSDIISESITPGIPVDQAEPLISVTPASPVTPEILPAVSPSSTPLIP